MSPTRIFNIAKNTITLTLLCGLMSVACFGQDQLGAITRKLPGERMRNSSGLFDPESNADAFRIEPGETVVLAELDGPGEIRHIWFTLSSRDYFRYPRTLVLRVYWDDSPIPSVETPVGDFFAAGHGMKANVSSLPIEATSYGRALNSYWKMPFRKKAKLTMTNEAKQGNATCYFYIDWQKLDKLPPDSLYFHARYHQEWPVKPFTPYTVLAVEGDGQYVGTVMSLHSSMGSWFGESDDRFTVDGEEEPRLVGTGFEDYFTDAWNLRHFSNMNAGVTIREPHGEDARHTCYRWHIQDPITFKKSLKVEIERRSFVSVKDPETGEIVRRDFVYRPDFCSSVAFWYQRAVATPTEPFPTLEERLVPEIWIVPRTMAEPEVEKGKSPLKASPGLKPESRRNKMGWTNFARRILYMHNDQVGSFLEIPFTVREEGRYSISVFQILFREYGIWKLTLIGPDTEDILAERLDFWNPYMTKREYTPENGVYGTNHEAKVGIRDLKPGKYVLKFECVGTNPLSYDETTGKNGYSIGIDGISLRKLPWGNMHAWLKDYVAKEERLQKQRAATAARTVAKLDEAVGNFKADCGRYPKSLDELIERPVELNMSWERNLGKWPYFKAKRIPTDPWGQHYRYLVPGRHNLDHCDIWSVRGNSRQTEGWIGNWDTP
ncbi:MAG: DUF2961 domain-containing protein [Pirellulales bacterium]|nr:DUF2961 domain-containing protein [Pirellulales bacterium]